MGQPKILLDSNILIHILHRNESVRKNIERVGWENCCISEITVVELLYGAECSEHPEENRRLSQGLIESLSVIPFGACIQEFCKQKARLRRVGKLIEDSDLYIGCTALALGIPLATENVKHLRRIEGLQVENWVER